MHLNCHQNAYILPVAFFTHITANALVKIQIYKYLQKHEVAQSFE